jgi:exopolysaccharide biosynthesis polyprenyl glycosylphosphotransferase
MISQRLRGLVNLHAVVTTLMATLLFFAYANVVLGHWLLPMVDLLPDVTLAPYVLCVLAGMALSTRYLMLYAPRFHRITAVDAARIATRQTLGVALLIFTLMFAVKDRLVSRIFLGTYLCWLWGILLLVNQALPSFLSRLLFQKQHLAPTLFVGETGQLSQLSKWLATKEALGIQPVGVLSADGRGSSDGGIPFLGPLGDLARVIDEKLVAQVIVLAMPATREEGRFLIETCQDRGCRLLIYSNLAEIVEHPLVLVQEEGHTFYSLQDEPLEDPLNRTAKRAFDIVVSLPVVLIVLPPLAIWAWVMQQLQAPGKLLFAQRRSGQRGNEFQMLKFRSMYEAAPGAATESEQARVGDKRIYPFGAFLRRTSLDEFPQFLNVLLGSMSIVGPRPHMPEHDNRFSQFYRGYRTRHFAKPGITGLAQIRGFRGEITDPTLLQQRVENDLLYISNWSIWLDLLITIKTVRHVIFPPKTAY